MIHTPSYLARFRGFLRDDTIDESKELLRVLKHSLSLANILSSICAVLHCPPMSCRFPYKVKLQACTEYEWFRDERR